MPNNILDDLDEIEEKIEHPKLHLNFDKAPSFLLALKKFFLGLAFMELCIIFIMAFKPHFSKASWGEAIFIVILLIVVCPATAAIGYVMNYIFGYVIEFLRQVLFLGIGKLVVEPQKSVTNILTYQRLFMGNYVELFIGLLSFGMTSFIFIQILLEQ
ncbi:MAG: hypothetical protein ACRBFS_02400 [Aureispira sp.]